jgi:NADH-quinone oxidoreductase subunit G
MPTFKLDGQEIPFEDGDTVLRAAWRNGIEIPHYCWHPGLSVAANCRICLVEIKSGRVPQMPVLQWDPAKNDYISVTKPKLQPACQQQVQEGMEVESKSEHALDAQKAVQEFLLLNHPVDCPICDQSGECKLQDYWLEHQQELKRKTSEPVHKPKGVRFGPTIVYDAERCIMCTRCIRVCDELVGDHVLDMRERGNRNEIVLAPGRELDHDYTLMTEHVCPVGALTSRDFRFKARVWFLKSAPGVCTGCATGCNDWVDHDPRYNRVYRLRPRDNADVNKFWMCDDGMMTYKRVHEGRVLSSLVGRGEGRTPMPYETSIELAAKRFADAEPGKTAVVLSAQHPTEDVYAVARLARETLGTERAFLAALPDWKGDDILRHPDQNPNRAGAIAAAEQVFGRPPAPLRELPDLVASGEVDTVLALGFASSEGAEALAPLAEAATVVHLTSNLGPLSEVANLVIPVASFAEMTGTFTNAQGRKQRFSRAIPATAGVRPAWETVAAIARAMGGELPELANVDQVRTALGGVVQPTERGERPAAGAGDSSEGAGAPAQGAA